MGTTVSKIFSKNSELNSDNSITLSDFISKAKTGDLVLI